MQLSCEVCHAPLRPEDVRLDLAVARCYSCNAVYDLSGRKARGLVQTPEEQPRQPRAKAPLPEKFQVEDDNVSTRISWRWLSFAHLLMIFFCIAWDGFLFAWYGGALTSKNPPLIMLIFPVAHVAAGIGITYSTLAGLMNRTRIEVSRNRLTIRHGPLPWLGNLDVPGRQFTQLYGVEQISKGDDSTKITYDLMALERSGKTVKLLSGLTDKEQVLYLEQTLERRLGIEDAPVDGEVATRSPAA